MAEQIRKQRVLVCGATGFIGRNVVERLAKRADLEVHAVAFSRPPYDLPGVKWRRCDLRDPDAVMEITRGVDVLVQAAATTSGAKDIVARPYIHITDNAVMNSLLLRACHDNAVGHFIFMSCSVMYQSSAAPVTEDAFNAGAAMHPNYFGIGWTKVYVEKMCEFFARLGKTKHTVIRHSNIYGPHDKFDLERSHVLGATITKVMTAETGRIAVWGKGEEKRDFLYVDDLVEFIVRAVDRPSSGFGLYNCGSGRAVAVKDLVQKIIEASGRNIQIEFDAARPSIDFELALDSGKALRELGWKNTTTLEEGLAKTIAWWRASRATR